MSAEKFLTFLKRLALFVAILLACVFAQSWYTTQATQLATWANILIIAAMIFAGAVAFKGFREGVVKLAVSLALVQVFLGIFAPQAAIGTYYPGDIHRIPVSLGQFPEATQKVLIALFGGVEFISIYMGVFIPLALLITVVILNTLTKVFDKIEKNP